MSAHPPPAPTCLCHWCGEVLPLGAGRSIACMLPCCGDLACKRAQRRRYAARARAFARDVHDDDVIRENIHLRQRLAALTEQLQQQQQKEG
jgi:hypothetical protein